MADEKETRTPDQIRADIEATREELGDTVEALAAKTDVKARAHDRVDELKTDARAKTDEVRAKVKDALPGGGDGTPSGPGAPSAGEKVSAGANQVAAKAKANPLPIAVAVALLVGYLVGRGRDRS